MRLLDKATAVSTSEKNMYTLEEANDATLAYFGGDELATSVWITKYALRDKNGMLLEKTPVDMHHRLAREFARIERKYSNPMSEDEIFKLLSDWTIVPQGSPMSGVGNIHQLQSLSNCFVIEPCSDSFGSILKTDEEQCQIMKRRGGVGHDISNIRPKGAPTNNAAKTTDGIGAFMERFSNSCRTTAQGGRRGALMLTIDVAHSEIETFIDIKRDKAKVTGANISIKLSDAFMNAVENDSEFTLQWPVNVPVEKARTTKTIKARDLWDKIISAAHDNAEPGLLFWDNIHKYGPADAYPEFKSSSTNPCGEIALSPYDSCRLLLLNVTKFVKNEFAKNSEFDFKKFSLVVQKAQRLMDDLVDLELECIDAIIQKIENDPEPVSIKRNELELWQKIRAAGAQGRRTGLGITGLGDVLAFLNIKYGSDESIVVTEKIYQTLAVGAYKSSVIMAKERGAFPVHRHVIDDIHPFIERILSSDKNLRSLHSKHGRRNIALTTTAPAGSVSLLTQTTSGIEPVFMLSYTRRKKINPSDTLAKVDFIDALGDKWEHFEVYHHGLKKWLDLNPGVDIKQSPYHDATSADINWNKRIALQAAAQKWICHSISSTINLPKDTTIETVKQIYMQGWKQNLKGLTIYRDGCRDGVMVEKQPEQNPEKITTIQETHAPRRPKELECDIHRVTVKGESYIVFVGLLDKKPYEIFVGSNDKIEIPKKCTKGILQKNGKKDGIATYNLSIPFGEDQLIFKNIVELFDNPSHGSLTRAISLSLRHGIPIQFIAEQLKKDKHSDMTSFSACMARVLSKSYIIDGTKATSEKSCPDCKGTDIIYQSGCSQCASCGYSKC